MPRGDRLIEEFRNARDTYPWRKFASLLRILGYEKLKPGKTSGSRRKFFNPETKLKIYVDEPHGGQMTRGMVKRLQDDLREKGIL